MNKLNLKNILLVVCFLSLAGNFGQINGMMMSPTSLVTPFAKCISVAVKVISYWPLKKYRMCGCKDIQDYMDRLLKYEYFEDVNKYFCSNGYGTLVEFLNESSCYVQDCTPLCWACIINDLDMVKKLLKNGAKASIDLPVMGRFFHNNGATPLYLACKHGNLEMVRFLLENGADLDKVDGWGETPLVCACGDNNIELVELLLENMTDKPKSIGIARNDRINALFRTTSTKIMDLLLKHGGNELMNKLMSEVVGQHESVLYNACSTKNEAKVELLLIWGARIDQASKKAAETVKSRGKGGKILELLELAEMFDESVKTGRRYLFEEASKKEGLYDFAKRLENGPRKKIIEGVLEERISNIKKRINSIKDEVDSYGAQAKDLVLVFAILDKDLEVVKKLVKEGAEIDTLHEIQARDGDVRCYLREELKKQNDAKREVLKN